MEPAILQEPAVIASFKPRDPIVNIKSDKKMVGSLTRHPLCSFEVTWLPTRKETSRLKQLGKLYLLSILSRAELRLHNHAPNDHTESSVTRSQVCDNNETYDLA